jgi:hypothetical protein
MRYTKREFKGVTDLDGAQPPNEAVLRGFGTRPNQRRPLRRGRQGTRIIRRPNMYPRTFPVVEALELES